MNRISEENNRHDICRVRVEEGREEGWKYKKLRGERKDSPLMEARTDTQTSMCVDTGRRTGNSRDDRE